MSPCEALRRREIRLAVGWLDCPPGGAWCAHVCRERVCMYGGVWCYQGRNGEGQTRPCTDRTLNPNPEEGWPDLVNRAAGTKGRQGQRRSPRHASRG